MIIDYTQDNIYQHQTYIGVGLALNWSGSAVAAVAVYTNPDPIIIFPIPVDEIDFIDVDDMISFGG